MREWRAVSWWLNARRRSAVHLARRPWRAGTQTACGLTVPARVEGRRPPVVDWDQGRAPTCRACIRAARGGQ